MSRSFLLRSAPASLLALAIACGGGEPQPVAPVPTVPPPTTAAPQASAEPPPVHRDTPDAPFRAEAPPGGPAVTFVPPKIETFSLKNGIPVYLVERHDLPVASVRLVVRAGAGEGERPALFATLGAMLEQGTKDKDALQISDAYEALGAQHGAWFDWDAGGAYVKLLVKDLEAGLRLVADEWLAPTFPEAELDRVRTRRLTSLAQEKMSPGAMAQNALAASLFGRKHPYGNNLFGREADVKAVTRDELVKLHKSRSATGRLAIVVAGDTTRAGLTPMLESTFGGLPKAEKQIVAAKPSQAPSPVNGRLVFVHLRGATQSNVLVAGAGTDAAYKDRDALAVMNSIFGGAFASRINMNLREKHAYTYGARSRFSMRRGAGPFTVGGAIVAEHTGEAITEIMNELDSMVKTDVTADELALAKENIRLGMPGRFETVADVTSAVTDIPAYGLPLDEFTTRSARIDAVGAKDVRRVASAFLVKEKLRVIVVGDRDKVLPQLQKLGLGEPLELDAYGDPAPKTPVAAGPAPAAPPKTPAPKK